MTVIGSLSGSVLAGLIAMGNDFIPIAVLSGLVGSEAQLAESDAHPLGVDADEEN